MNLPGPLNTSIVPFGVSPQELRTARKIVEQVHSEFHLFAPDLDGWDGSPWDKDPLPRSIRVTQKDLQSHGYPSEYTSLALQADEEGKVVRFDVKKTDGTSTSFDEVKLDGWIHPRFRVRSKSTDSSLVMDGSTGGYKILKG